MAEDKNIQKAIDEMVDEKLGQSNDVEKSMPTSLPENGGGDTYNSGSPHTEPGQGSKGGSAGSMYDGDVHAGTKEGDPIKQSEPSEKTGEKHKKKSMKKSEDESKDEKENKVEKSEETKTEKLSKAEQELGDISDEEIELIKAWREEIAAEAEEVAKAQTAPAGPSAEDLSKAITEAVTTAVEPLQKKLEKAEEINKSLTEKVEKMASQPAYNKRSIQSLDTLEKSGDAPEIQKSQVLDKMLELQMSGKGVTSTHIAEFEATGNISDPVIKNKVMEQFK